MELNFKSFGQGDPVVILHGLFGMLDNWQTIAKELAKHYSVFIVDQRNHGRSPHSEEFNYSIMAEDLRDFLESQWIYKSHIIGHSMGGKTAMQFALDNPEMVDRLVVVDIGPDQNTGNHSAIYDALLQVPIDTIQSRKEAEALLATHISDFGIRQFLLKNLSRRKEGGYRWKMNLPVLHTKYEEILKSIHGDQAFEEPTLFIKGGRSNYLQETDLPQIQHLFPAAEMHTVADAGYWVHAEKPKELLALVQSFLA